jgi:hypothetical protein
MYQIDLGIGSPWLVTLASTKLKGLYYKNLNVRNFFGFIDAGIGSTWPVTPASNKPKGLYYKTYES